MLKPKEKRNVYETKIFLSYVLICVSREKKDSINN